MARTDITVQTPPAVGSAPAALTYTALTGSSGDNGNSCNFTGGREHIQFRNVGATERNVVISSVADSRLSRLGNIEFALAAGAVKMLPILPADGFRQSNGKLHFEADHADVEVAIVRR